MRRGGVEMMGCMLRWGCKGVSYILLNVNVTKAGVHLLTEPLC